MNTIGTISSIILATMIMLFSSPLSSSHHYTSNIRLNTAEGQLHAYLERVMNTSYEGHFLSQFMQDHISELRGHLDYRDWGLADIGASTIMDQMDSSLRR